MRIIVTGSIATDHLMTYPGRFSEHFIADKLDTVSLSFLVDDLDVRRGGVAANICFGLARLGFRAVLVGAVGRDFEEYRSWLEGHGIDTDSVRVSPSLHTARFLCTTDDEQNQIASFYTGAMAEAREIDLVPIVATDGVDLVVVGPNDPDAMLRHTEDCRRLGYPFASDPSQQLARLTGEQVRSVVRGAAYLFTNEYERDLLLAKSGWTPSQVLAEVGVWITTLGEDGARVESSDGTVVEVPAAPERSRVDPTGVGDAFRAGFLSGVGWGLGLRSSTEIGCMLATLALESNGSQEYGFDRGDFLARLAAAYGSHLAAAVDRSLLSLTVRP